MGSGGGTAVKAGVSARGEGRPILSVVWLIRCKNGAVDGRVGWEIDVHVGWALC